MVKITTESSGNLCLFGGTVIGGSLIDIADIGASSKNRGPFSGGRRGEEGSWSIG